VGSLSVIELVGIVWLGPPAQVGTLSASDLLPLAYVRLSDRAMLVPQTNVLDVWILNGVELTPPASMTMSGYVALPWTTVTPGVDVVSVAEIADSVAQPMFSTPTFRLTHSSRLTTPLPLPDESSIVTPLDWRFEVPVMQKSWVAVPPLVGLTGAEAGVALAQLRSASAAVAV
jgi:hypothetical protein